MDDVLTSLAGVALPDVAPASGTVGLCALDALAPRCTAQVWRVDARSADQPEERARQLADIGFVPGERVTVLIRAWPGGDPLVVRVGHSRFALRRAEAACVQVSAVPPGP